MNEQTKMFYLQEEQKLMQQLKHLDPNSEEYGRLKNELYNFKMAKVYDRYNS